MIYHWLCIKLSAQNWESHCILWLCEWTGIFTFSHLAAGLIYSQLQIRNKSNLDFSVLLKDILAWGLEELGIEQLTLQLVDNLYYILIHSCSIYLLHK